MLFGHYLRSRRNDKNYVRKLSSMARLFAMSITCVLCKLYNAYATMLLSTSQRQHDCCLLIYTFHV